MENLEASSLVRIEPLAILIYNNYVIKSKFGLDHVSEIKENLR